MTTNKTVLTVYIGTLKQEQAHFTGQEVKTKVGRFDKVPSAHYTGAMTHQWCCQLQF